MSIKDRFPDLHSFMASRPEQLGSEIVLLVQGLRENFHPNNYLDHVAALYGQNGVSREFVQVWQEGIEWAKRTLLLMPDPSQPFGNGWLTLTRAGRAFTSEALNRLLLQQLLPDFMLHPDVKRHASVTPLDPIKAPKIND